MDPLSKKHEAERREALARRKRDRGVLTRRLRAIEENRPDWFRDPPPAQCARCRDTGYVTDCEAKNDLGDVQPAARPCPSCKQGQGIARRRRASAGDESSGSVQQTLEGLNPVKDFKKSQGGDE
jgi:hypothetical protein